MRHNFRPYRTALRRGIGLALILSTGWILSQTVPLSLPDPPEDSPALAISLLASQLPSARSEDAESLSGWCRLLLSQSSHLSAAEEEILSARQAQNESSEPSTDPGTADAAHSPALSDSSAAGNTSSADRSQEPPDPEEEEDNLPQTPASPPENTDADIVEMTARGNNSGTYMFAEGVYLYNRTRLDLDASVATSGSIQISLGEGPQILIVHTHGSEAYSQSDGDVYQESDSYRTTDCSHNVVQVGEDVATVFRAHGFQVIHDPTLFDYPAYNGAYERSGAAVTQWLKKYPSIQVVLDVHRDALEGSNGEIYKLVSEEAGQKVAQVMFVLGTDGGGSSHPNWRNNLALAVRLQQNLVRGYSDLARPIVLRNSRYNQQLLPGSLLVEFGGHGNTLSEARAAARLWADNVARTLLALKEDGS